MERLPVEVVGNILSHISAPRDVISASATCRKWRRAFQKHLHVLSFKSSDWHGFHDLSTSQVEILITWTIFQTTRLRSLLLELDYADELSAAAVMTWLLYTRKSLKELHYDVRTDTALNVLDICGRRKLEKLTWKFGRVERVDPNYHRFTALRSLSLCYVHITGLDLSALLAACPKLDYLDLVELVFSGYPVDVEVRTPNLRSFYIQDLCLDKLVLESGSVEDLHLVECTLGFFKVIGTGSLKRITVDTVMVPHFEICGSAESLETLEIISVMIPLPDFYGLVSKCSKLRTLRLWDLAYNEAIDLEIIAISCPQLSLLAIGYDLNAEESLPRFARGSTQFENVVHLRVGWSGTLKDDFSGMVEHLVELCPSLKKLDVEGVVSGLNGQHCQVFARFTTSIVRIMRKYADVNVHFEL